MGFRGSASYRSRRDMRDPVGFLLLTTLGAAALAAAVVGLRRGRSVSIVQPLRFYRAPRPLFFWDLVTFQLAVAITCIAGAVRAF
jgi:hypothetical protein